jgi:serine protease Do
MPPSRTRALVAVVLTALVAGCAAPSVAQPDTAVHWKESPSNTAAPELVRFNNLLADLAERVKPGLVHVRVVRAASKEEADEPTEHRRSSGSGFVIDESGLIVTNAHVVEDADTIQVNLPDGRRTKASVVGKDRRVDLALIKVTGVSGLTALPMGDSNRLRVGEFVLALGHPFNLEHTVSFGIVSRKGAPLTVAAPGFDFIQTDAAINPGNSGGPLVNMAGEVIGVNSMAARNGSIGFAIPSNLVKMLVPQLASKGRVDWGWLGVTIADLTDEDAARLQLKDAHGVLIRSVLPGEPAEKSGLKANDVILAVGETKLETSRDLQRVVSILPAGTRLKVKVVRDGHEHELDVTVGLYKDLEAREK